tara:strand:+ start:12613 stop:12900 length:288 start_codon:yes stop_codon:yes gene_type:complete
MISNSQRVITYSISDRFQLDITFDIIAGTSLEEGKVVASLSQKISEFLVIDVLAKNLAFKAFNDFQSAVAFMVEHGTPLEELGHAINNYGYVIKK